MALLTAKQFKNRETPEFLVDLGDGSQVLCRRPDLQTLIFNKFLPMPLVNAVAGLISTWQGKTEQELTTDVLEHNAEMAEFVDRWVCATLVSPRCVLATDAEGNPVVVPDDAICITDLRLETKSLIFRETFAAQRSIEVAAVAEDFSEGGSGEGSGPGSEEVRSEAVVAAGD